MRSASLIWKASMTRFDGGARSVALPIHRRSPSPSQPMIGLAEPNPAGLIRNCQSTFAVRETGTPSPSSQAVIRARAPRLPRMAKLFDNHRLSEIARLVDVGSQDKRSVVRKKLQ